MELENPAAYRAMQSVVALYGGEHVVKVVGHTPGQQADGLHLLSLHQLGVNVLLFASAR
jgi:hypothetical protein